MFLLTAKDLDQIFSSYYLLNKGSFFVIDPKTKTYQTDQVFESLLSYNQYIKKQYESGCTIIVKNLENYLPAIKKETLRFGLDVDVHMYLVPAHGQDSFDFHTDDRDVVIQMIYGTKTFEIKINEQIKTYQLNEKNELMIPKGVLHRALPSGASCLLSYGYQAREDYFVPLGISHSSHQPNLISDETHYMNDLAT